MEYQSFDRFEYKFERLNQYNQLFQLNQLGQDGWELVQIIDGKYLFKRKLSCILTD